MLSHWSEEEGDRDHGLQDPLQIQRVQGGGGAAVRLYGQDGGVSKVGSLKFSYYINKTKYFRLRLSDEV